MAIQYTPSFFSTVKGLSIFFSKCIFPLHLSIFKVNLHSFNCNKVPKIYHGCTDVYNMEKLEMAKNAILHMGNKLYHLIW